jgi:hypothetical protein
VLLLISSGACTIGALDLLSNMVVCSDSNDGPLDRYVTHAHECVLFLFFPRGAASRFRGHCTYVHARRAGGGRGAACSIDPCP